MNTPDFEAAARYTPFLDIARAVIAPVHASWESVEVFDQSFREIVTISTTLQREVVIVIVDPPTMSTSSNEEVLARGVPDYRAIITELRRPADIGQVVLRYE